MPVNTKLKVKRAIYNIFTKKYGLHVQTEATKYLEDLLIDEEDLSETLERILNAYKKRYAGKESA
jgi:DNA polymerase epsilon subunit 2